MNMHMKALHVQLATALQNMNALQQQIDQHVYAINDLIVQWHYQFGTIIALCKQLYTVSGGN